MSTNQSANMATKIYNLVSCLADNYGFDADEAYEFIQWETDVNHVEVICPKKDEEKPASKAEEKSEPKVENDAVATCRKNIELWTKKLKEGKVKDVAKQQEKIEKEEKKLAKLLQKSPDASSKTASPATTVSKTDSKEKRIKRMSPVMADQLKLALRDVKLEYTDKLKKEFVEFVEELTEDDFRKQGLADHMRSFAKLKAPDVEKKPESEEDKEDEQESEEEDEVPQAQSVAVGGGPSNPSPKRIPLEDLQKIEMTASVGPVGNFWDADNGRFVTGPDADEDEDVDEVEFEGKTYAVGEKTGRVYEPLEDTDKFVGFIGVGKFKAMKRS